MATRGKSYRGGSTTRKSKSRSSGRSSKVDDRPIAHYYYPEKSILDRAKDASRNLYNRASKAVRDEVTGVRDTMDVYGAISKKLGEVTNRR